MRFSHQAPSRERDARRETDLLPAQHRLPRQGVHHARAPQPPRLGHMPRRARVRGRQATRRERVGLAVHPSREPLRRRRGQAPDGRAPSLDRGPRALT